MREIGHVQQLQIQLGGLKKGERPNRHYDPTPLRTVPALRLTPKGVVGLVDGQELIDVHHADHPRSKNRTANAISFNFSPHYQLMRDRFGGHLEIGCGGENILIATEDVPAWNDFSRGLIVQSGDGSHGRFTRIQVAHPCLSFSAYVLNTDEPSAEAEIKATLQFLDGGTRGFYCGWEGDPLVIRPGDRVYLLTET